MGLLNCFREFVLFFFFRLLSQFVAFTGYSLHFVTKISTGKLVALSLSLSLSLSLWLSLFGTGMYCSVRLSTVRQVFTLDSVSGTCCDRSAYLMPRAFEPPNWLLSSSFLPRALPFSHQRNIDDKQRSINVQIPRYPYPDT